MRDNIINIEETNYNSLEAKFGKKKYNLINYNSKKKSHYCHKFYLDCLIYIYIIYKIG